MMKNLYVEKTIINIFESKYDERPLFSLFRPGLPTLCHSHLTPAAFSSTKEVSRCSVYVYLHIVNIYTDNSSTTTLSFPIFGSINHHHIKKNYINLLFIIIINYYNIFHCADLFYYCARKELRLRD